MTSNPCLHWLGTECDLFGDIICEDKIILKCKEFVDLEKVGEPVSQGRIEDIFHYAKRRKILVKPVGYQGTLRLDINEITAQGALWEEER